MIKHSVEMESLDAEETESTISSAILRGRYISSSLDDPEARSGPLLSASDSLLDFYAVSIKIGRLNSNQEIRNSNFGSVTPHAT